MTKQKNRLLSKLASERQVLGTHGAEDRSVLNIHEDLSTGVTTQLPTEVEFRKKSNEYRPCVGIMLFNKQGHIFTGKRFDSDAHWQMPQGGIDDGEDLEQTALRELLEEVGTNKVEIVTKNKDWIYYDLPQKFIPSCWGGKYCGQKQRWFLMRFLGEDQDINIHYTTHPEFKEWCWQSIDNLVNSAISFKKEIYKMVIEEFSSIIKLQ